MSSLRNDSLVDSSSSQIPDNQIRHPSKRFRPSVQCSHRDLQTNEQCSSDGFMECVHCEQICCLKHITQHQEELKVYRDELVQVWAFISNFDCIFCVLFERKRMKLI
mgnify:FL=1